MRGGGGCRESGDFAVLIRLWGVSAFPLHQPGAEFGSPVNFNVIAHR